MDLKNARNTAKTIGLGDLKGSSGEDSSSLSSRTTTSSSSSAAANDSDSSVDGVSVPSSADASSGTSPPASLEAAQSQPERQKRREEDALRAVRATLALVNGAMRDIDAAQSPDESSRARAVLIASTTALAELAKTAAGDAKVAPASPLSPDHLNVNELARKLAPLVASAMPPSVVNNNATFTDLQLTNCSIGLNINSSNNVVKQRHHS